MNRIAYSIGIIAFLFNAASLPLSAQDKKGTVRIDLSYHQQNDDLPVLKVSAKTKVEKRFEPVDGLDINLFLSEETAAGFIGSVRTTDKGLASLRLPAKFRTSLDALPEFKFIATVAGNPRFEDGSVEIDVAKARIELTLVEEDSVRTMYAKVSALQDSNWVDVPETEIKFVLRRLLSDLQAGEEALYTTDESGEASAPFELVVPGDVNGDIIIGAKIEDNELYGNLVATKAAKWGVPLVQDKRFAQRTLWATRDKTPLWLLIFPNLIIAGVWGMIFYLIYLIYSISKLGKTDKSI